VARQGLVRAHQDRGEAPCWRTRAQVRATEARPGGASRWGWWRHVRRADALVAGHLFEGHAVSQAQQVFGREEFDRLRAWPTSFDWSDCWSHRGLFAVAHGAAGTAALAERQPQVRSSRFHRLWGWLRRPPAIQWNTRRRRKCCPSI